MNLILSVPPRKIFSEILIQRGILQGDPWIKHVKRIGSRFVIITDHLVRDLYGSSLRERLLKDGCETHLFSVPRGEESKSRKWKDFLEDEMQKACLGRDIAILAVGGGVVSDLAGFVAATYCRGVPFLTIPTTLLGQIDASIGGKVAINTPHEKNLIGALHHPQLVLIDPDTLSTLPQKEFRNGMAEAIKYALIASKTLFEKLKNNSPWEELIYACCSIKKEIVEKDAQEEGLRRILNFGHTVGHALETAMDYRISHGEAVAIGILAEARLSYRLGYLKKEEFLLAHQLLERYGFTLKVPSEIDKDKFIKSMKRDKKALCRNPRFVLLQSIGETLPFAGEYCNTIDEEILRETVQWLFSR